MKAYYTRGQKLRGQKYAVGERVRTIDNMPTFKSAFRAGGEEATVLYSYGQACGGDSHDSYRIEFDDGSTAAWYSEKELIPINKEQK